MAFWKELISQGLTKGKSLFKGGIELAAKPQTKTMLFQGGAKLVSSAKTTIGWAGKIGHWASEHPKTSIVGLGVALPYFGYDKGVINFAKERLGDKEAEGKGVANVAADVLMGKDVDEYGNDKAISERVVNTMLGDGAYDSMKSAGGAVIDETTNLYYAGKETVSNVAGGVRNLYNDGRNMVAGAFNGNGMVANGNGGYVDPTTQQYPSFAQYAGLQQTDGGMLSGLMGGMNNAIDTVSGGNVSKMNIATLVLSAYMMFGRFGWLGKMASLMLGGMTLKNINNHQQANMQQTLQSQQPVQSQRPEQVPQYASYNQNNDDDNVVRMTRRM